MAAGGALTARIVPGLALVVAGALLLLHNLGWISLGDPRRYWPLALVALGVHLILQGRRRGFGAVVALAGLALQLDELRWIRLEWSALWRYWPLALVVAGLRMLWRAKR